VECRVVGRWVESRRGWRLSARHTAAVGCVRWSPWRGIPRLHDQWSLTEPLHSATATSVESPTLARYCCIMTSIGALCRIQVKLQRRRIYRRKTNGQTDRQTDLGIASRCLALRRLGLYKVNTKENGKGDTISASDTNAVSVTAKCVLQWVFTPSRRTVALILQRQRQRCLIVSPWPSGVEIQEAKLSLG